MKLLYGVKNRLQRIERQLSKIFLGISHDIDDNDKHNKKNEDIQVEMIPELYLQMNKQRKIHATSLLEYITNSYQVKNPVEGTYNTSISGLGVFFLPNEQQLQETSQKSETSLKYNKSNIYQNKYSLFNNNIFNDGKVSFWLVGDPRHFRIPSLLLETVEGTTPTNYDHVYDVEGIPNLSYSKIR